MREKLSSQVLLDRWEDRRACQNLIGKFSHSYLTKEEGLFYGRFWSKRDDVSLGLNKGYYIGEEAIRGYFDAVDANTQVKSRLVQKLFPEFLAHRSDEDIHGVGETSGYPIVAGGVEIAGDGQTAKGCWLCFGADVTIGTNGPVHRWQYGTMAADFILEDSQWRIWHLSLEHDHTITVGENYAKVPVRQAPEEDPLFVNFGSPTIPREVYDPFFGWENMWYDMPRPYETMTAERSYGPAVMVFVTQASRVMSKVSGS